MSSFAGKPTSWPMRVAQVRISCQATITRHAQASFGPGVVQSRQRAFQQARTQPDQTMKITAIETINLEEFPNLLWVHLHTDEGIVGLGETFYAVEPVIAHIHQTIAPLPAGPGPARRSTSTAATSSTTISASRASGAEMRAGSAVDIALWDILGQVTNQPDLPTARRRDPRQGARLQHLRWLSVRAREVRAGHGELRHARRRRRSTSPTRTWSAS